MSANAPTTDRLFLGIFAGAAVGSVVLPLSLVLFSDASLPGPPYMVLAWSIVALALLVTIVVIHMPVWWIVEKVGLKGAAGAFVAGALSLLAMPFVINLLLSGDAFAGGVHRQLGLLGAFAFAGALIGFVIWRVAKWELAPR